MQWIPGNWWGQDTFRSHSPWGLSFPCGEGCGKVITRLKLESHKGTIFWTHGSGSASCSHMFCWYQASSSYGVPAAPSTEKDYHVCFNFTTPLRRLEITLNSLGASHVSHLICLAHTAKFHTVNVAPLCNSAIIFLLLPPSYLIPVCSTGSCHFYISVNAYFHRLYYIVLFTQLTLLNIFITGTWYNT